VCRTIEYRYFDSSLDPARLQANIQLACSLTRRAGELPDSAIPVTASGWAATETPAISARASVCYGASPTWSSSGPRTS